MRPLELVSAIPTLLAAVLLLAISPPAGRSQNASKPPTPSGEKTTDKGIGDLQKQMTELKSALEELRGEIVRSHKETVELRQELEATRQQLATAVARPARAPNATAGEGQVEPGSPLPVKQVAQEAFKKLEEDQQLTNAKLDELYQTTVSSGSKYRVRLSGIALVNVFGNRGVVDNLDFPSVVPPDRPIDSGGSFGGTVRQ